MKQYVKAIIPYKVRVKLRLLQHQIFPTSADINERKQFFIRRKFYSQFIKSGDICFDIGANTGNRTSVFLSLGAKVIAMEPQKELCAYLKARYGRKITVVQKGVGEKEDQLELFSLGRYNALASFSQQWTEQGRFKSSEWVATETVAVTTLDKLIELYGLPNFIKIDTEGFEYKVLQGLSHRIPYLSFEYMTPELDQQTISCIQRLGEINKNIVCNFSAQESMRLNLETWISPQEMTEYIQTKEFIETDFGDIYIKSL